MATETFPDRHANNQWGAVSIDFTNATDTGRSTATNASPPPPLTHGRTRQTVSHSLLSAVIKRKGRPLQGRKVFFLHPIYPLGYQHPNISAVVVVA